jgi:hypothetical protein
MLSTTLNGTTKGSSVDSNRTALQDRSDKSDAIVLFSGNKKKITTLPYIVMLFVTK